MILIQTLCKLIFRGIEEIKIRLPADESNSSCKLYIIQEILTENCRIFDEISQEF
jgi:hypothetical protein